VLANSIPQLNNMYEPSLPKKSMTIIVLFVSKTKCLQWWLSKRERERVGGRERERERRL